jgi:nifR3 family TIM-barrel protein
MSLDAIQVLGTPVRYFLAPMAGITDVVFRTFMREMGADVVVSELVSAEGLVRGGQRTRELLVMSLAERPVGIQIFGAKTETLAEAARIVENLGADFVDINCGCPVKKIVSDGAGAAWLKSPVAMARMICEVSSAVKIPVSVKVRTGWDDTSVNLLETARLAHESGARWVSVHGRTRTQGYSGSADWDLIKKVSCLSPIPIVGNGDILTGERARVKIESGCCHAVMIGRGALKNPWIFSQAKNLQSTRTLSEIIERHFELALRWKERRRAFFSLKKFMSWYASGFPGVAQFRAALFGTNDLKELRLITTAFFAGIHHSTWVEDRSPFLLGGHG